MSTDTSQMRDPHVVALRYHIEHSAGIAFEDNTPPIERETAAFRMSLAHGIATFQMKDHYSSENRARQIVEMYLRPWEISEAVRPAGTKLRFIFDEAEVIDRDPSPLGPTATVTLMPIPRAEVRLLEKRYPDPPDNFTVSPDVEVMWTLYEGYLQGHDRLLPMAYTCLTRLLTEPQVTRKRRVAMVSAETCWRNSADCHRHRETKWRHASGSLGVSPNPLLTERLSG